MTILYNCHTDGDQYRITKFNDGEVESSYLCSIDECQCPAGHRPSCRHRQMLPMFLNRGAVDTYWFLDFDRKGWVSNEPAPLEIASMVILPDDISSDELANEFGRLLHPDSERSEFGSQQHESWPYNSTVTTADFASGDGSSILPAVANKPSWRRL